MDGIDCSRAVLLRPLLSLRIVVIGFILVAFCILTCWVLVHEVDKTIMALRTVSVT